MAKKSERQKKLERFAATRKRKRIYKIIALSVAALSLGIYIFFKYFLTP